MEAHSSKTSGVKALSNIMSLPSVAALPRRGSAIARNSLYNLIGQGIPLFAAFWAIPPLIHGLGADRFGVLTLAWVIVGYFSLFDLGLGRALTQLVAQELSEGPRGNPLPVVRTGLVLMCVLGLLGSVVVMLIASTLVDAVLKIPASLKAETLYAFYVLAAAIPIVVLTAGLAGVLSAFERFGVLNAIRGAMGTYAFVAPLAVLPFSRSLVLVTAVLVLGRLVAAGAHLLATWRVMPRLAERMVVERAAIRPLFRFGAWMSVTNVIGPLLVYLDRFVIGAVVSVAAVAYYATPYEMVTKLLIVPAAILGVLFPAFASSYRHDHTRMVRLFANGTKYVALLLFPVVLVVVALAPEGMGWWLGVDFSRYSAPVLRCLAIGIFMNSVAQVFATLVQGVGRPDLTAKLHALELPIYLPILFWSIHHYGIVGAAFAWTGRVGFDGVLLLVLSARVLKNPTVVRRIVTGLVGALVALALPLLIGPAAFRALVAGMVLIVFLVVSWSVALGDEERSSIKARVALFFA